MRHQIYGRKLGRSSDQRKALFKSLTTELFKHERIETTEAKAKAVRGQAEKLISLARKGDLASRRLVYAALTSKDVAKKLVDEIAPDYKGRNGGYTRMYKLGPRKGDAASMVLLELVDVASEPASAA